jgi:hypothetical protein
MGVIQSDTQPSLPGGTFHVITSALGLFCLNVVGFVVLLLFISWMGGW